MGVRRDRVLVLAALDGSQHIHVARVSLAVDTEQRTAHVLGHIAQTHSRLHALI